MNNKILFSIFLIIVCLIAPIQAYNITTDEITQTSIIWNLSEISSNTNITAISIDGYIISDYENNPYQINQNDLNAGTTHFIRVTDENNITTSGSVKTLIPDTTESEQNAAMINTYLIFFLGLICIIIGIFVPIVGLGACIFAIIGLTTSINGSFIMAFLFVVLLLAGLIEAITFSY